MEYKLVDSGNGRRLERFGAFLIDRPDPQIIWEKGLPKEEWDKANARFSDKWNNPLSQYVTRIPEKWQMEHEDIKFWLKLTPFKHTGVFPEQSSQWEYLEQKIKEEKHQINVLNLFAYTGIASLFAARAGAKVTHVDASRPSITWANENRELNNMQDLPIRWIVDDALKFTEREIKRGSKYDIIIMDPPVYGHSPNGEPWNFNEDFPKLMKNCKQILSENPVFVLVNTYAISSSSITLANTIQGFLGDLDGSIKNGELTIKEESKGRLLSTGIWARWSKN